MKKIIAVFIAGTFIIGTSVAQTETTPVTKPTAKKETMATTKKPVEKKDAAGIQKPVQKKKHHKDVKGKSKKAEITAPQSK